MSDTVMLHKKGDRMDPVNYRFYSFDLFAWLLYLIVVLLISLIQQASGGSMLHLLVFLVPVWVGKTTESC